MTHGDQSGYAMLAALVVTTLAMAVAATAVTAVSSHQAIAMDEQAAAQGASLTAAAVQEFCEHVRWYPHLRSGSARRTTDAGTCDFSWSDASSAYPSPTIRLNLTSKVGTCRDVLDAHISLARENAANGVVVNGDVVLRSAMGVNGSGLYARGSLEGRELLTFGPTDPSPDQVHGDVWPIAAAHVGGHIYAEGSEIHASGRNGEWPYDNDACGGGAAVADIAVPAEPMLLTALRQHSSSPGDALQDDVLDLSRLPLVPESGDVEASLLCCITPDPSQPLRVIGSRPRGFAPLVLIVFGDATVGSGDAVACGFRGGLVVTGALTVVSATALEGHLHAGSLNVGGPLTVVVPDVKAMPLAGLTSPCIVALSDGQT